MPIRFKDFLSQWVMPLAFVALLYAVLQAISAYILSGATLQSTAIAPDLVFHLAFALILLGLSRNRWTFMALISSLMMVLHLGNAAKIAILGSPLQPDDALAARSFFYILEGGWLVLAAGGVLLIVLSAMFAVTFRPRRAWLSWAAVFVAATPLLVAPQAVVLKMDEVFGNSVWDQRSNYMYRGPMVYLLQETARYASRVERDPTRVEVLAALQTLSTLLHPASFDASASAPAVSTTVGKPRNVHYIVLESFWDPTVLKKAEFSRDPMDKDFRALWQAGGTSHVHVPVFGGYTANSEFESLCGFPVTHDVVFFEGGLRNDVPCLPRLLSGAGYTSTTAHPNIAAFWNRTNAYDRIGFDVYWADKDFQLDDMNGDFLGDSSLYRQVLEKVQPLIASGTPVFNYVLTFFGHLDYPLNASRPNVIQVRNGGEWVERFANTIYYKSRELMAYINELRALDPDAVIVLFGDHLPFLGGSNEPYVASGFLAASKGDFTGKMLHDYVSTPLIIIDGKKGPMKLGDMPLYQVPSLVLKLVGQSTPPLLELTRSASDFSIRPLPGIHFVSGSKNKPVLCQGAATDPDVCTTSQQWLNSIATITVDVFSGKQYTLRELN